MPPKHAATKSPAIAPTPLVNALLLTAAVGYGLWLLVARGRVSWPPHDLLANAYTMAGCLALIGPVVLWRREGGEGGLGDLIWLTGGLLVWVFDLSALARGRSVSAASWATPLDVRTMGLMILAVVVAGWRSRGAGRSWTWTNVTGWLLALLWVGLAAASLIPARSIGLAAR